MSSPDLFVVCKSCGNEVSPYITECPYCGNRLRKRAPKLDKPGKPAKPPRLPRPSGRSRRTRETGRFGRADGYAEPRAGGKPVVTMALVLAAILATVTARGALFSITELAILEPLTPSVSDEPWRLVTSLFVYLNTGHEFVALGGIFLFGWLLERRHGWWAPLLVFLVAGAAGNAATLAETQPVSLGGHAAALGLLAAWSVRALREEDEDRDMLGVAVMAALGLVVPAAVVEADWLAGVAGLLAGAVLGLGLSRLRAR